MSHLRYGFMFAAVVAGLLAGCHSEPKLPEPTIPRPPAPEFAKLKNCFACHEADKHSGPSYAEIASVFRKNPNAIDVMSNRILNGSSDDFGGGKMPPQKYKITPDEARYLATWVLQH